VCDVLFLAAAAVRCNLYSDSTTPGDRRELEVHEGGDLVATCQCNTAIPFSIGWILNDEVIDDSVLDVDIENNHIETRSVITIKDISKRQEGSLCCTFNGTLEDCLQFQVSNSPVVNISYVADDVGCRTDREYNGTVTVRVKCTVFSSIKDYIDRGFMLLYVNKRDTKTFDNSPKERSDTTSSGETTWMKLYIFNQEVDNHDILHCVWVQENSKEMPSNSKLHVTFGECSKPTRSHSGTYVPTTAKTTEDKHGVDTNSPPNNTVSEEPSETQLAPVQSYDESSYVGRIAGSVAGSVFGLGLILLFIIALKEVRARMPRNSDDAATDAQRGTPTESSVEANIGLRDPAAEKQSAKEESLPPKIDLGNNGAEEMKEGCSTSNLLDSAKGNNLCNQIKKLA
jgi:hypothetical protein